MRSICGLFVGLMMGGLVGYAIYGGRFGLVTGITGGFIATWFLILGLAFEFIKEDEEQ